MLTKMPKVGDVLIANRDEILQVGGVTRGSEYELERSNTGSGHAVLVNDDNWRVRVTPQYFDLFTLKADVNNVGSIEEIEFETTEVSTSDFYAKYHVISLTVDDAGLASVRNLASQSGKQSLRKSIQTKIDALQKELDAI